MAYDLKRSAQAINDLELILEHLTASHEHFGESKDEAIEKAAQRILQIEDSFEQIAKKPHQGTLRPDLLPGIRNVTKHKAIIYFDVNDTEQIVRIFAVFFGGQNHQRHMLKRLLQAQENSRQSYNLEDIPEDIREELIKGIDDQLKDED